MKKFDTCDEDDGDKIIVGVCINYLKMKILFLETLLLILIMIFSLLFNTEIIIITD